MSPDRTRELEDRLLRCLPAGTHEMETLCRMAGLQATTDISSAAVECSVRPRLLINPDFVDRFCRTDEHLFLLVMHELWHILLGHTRLYPRLGPAQNIAFDAVINASLSRQFPAAEFRGFMEEVNPADSFPSLLLRPPVGWPRRPVYPEGIGPSGTTDVLRRLYPPEGDESVAMPLYSEILRLLVRAGHIRLLVGSEWAAPGPGEAWLLGDHGDHPSDMDAMSDPLFAQVVQRIVASWPRPPVRLRGRDLGRAVEILQASSAEPVSEVRRAFKRVLRRVLTRRPSRSTRVQRTLERVVGGVGVLPNPWDRTHHARLKLAGSTLLWNQASTQVVRSARRTPRACVYLDVSGSMGGLIPHLVGLLAPLARRGELLAFQFSTQVHPLSDRDLVSGCVKTTGGTTIGCVLDHLLALPRIRRALILTDGYTGAVEADRVRRLRTGGYELHVVLPHESAFLRDLKDAATTMTVLPSLKPCGGEA